LDFAVKKIQLGLNNFNNVKSYLPLNIKTGISGNWLSCYFIVRQNLISAINTQKNLNLCLKFLKLF